MEGIAYRLLRLHEDSGVLVALYDGFDRLQYANSAFRQTFVIGPDEKPTWAELMRRNFRAKLGTVISNEDFDQWLISTQSRRGKIPFRAFETDVTDGRWLWMTETVQADGWMLCIASDITSLRTDGRSLRQARDRALQSSHTDELTGIANRRYVTARAEEMLARPGQGTPGCVCILDLDHFKHINDQFGHHVGDLVLRDFAALLQRMVRRSDCFGRLGGEEFILVLPDTSIEAAEMIVERMLAAVRQSRPMKDAPGFHYSCSAGIAVARPGEPIEELFQRADRALYDAKMAGRDRIRLNAA